MKIRTTRYYMEQGEDEVTILEDDERGINNYLIDKLGSEMNYFNNTITTVDKYDYFNSMLCKCKKGRKYGKNYCSCELKMIKLQERLKSQHNTVEHYKQELDKLTQEQNQLEAQLKELS